jgi:hypothetical protein
MCHAGISAGISAGARGPGDAGANAGPGKTRIPRDGRGLNGLSVLFLDEADEHDSADLSIV